MHPQRVSIGPSDFRKLRQPGVLFVDKSDLIRRILIDPYETMLFPRPRRFGKSTNLSMLGYFLGLSQTDHSALFQDLAIWRSEEARRHFQRHPIISLTFKDIKKQTWPDCLAAVMKLLTNLYSQHADLSRDRMNPADARDFQAILDGNAAPEQYAEALRKLSGHLHAQRGERVVVLLDEYDTPLHESFLRGYYDDAVSFFRGLLSGVLKDNEHLFKGVLTGILRIARESIFSDLNNLGVYSLLKQDYATDFGFTEAEVDDLRRRLGSPLTLEALQRWYNGYEFGGQIIYNPWSLLSALAHPKEPLQPYWVNTASDGLLRELLMRFGGGAGEMEALLRGEGVRKAIRENIVLRDLYQDPEALWSFLLFTGYLKAEQIQITEEGTTGSLKVPNLEVAQVFRGLFSTWLDRGVGGEALRQRLIQSLLAGDAEQLQAQLGQLLLESASFHDVAGNQMKMPPEHTYQMFILGLLVSMPRHVVTANREGGHGRYDVLVRPREAGQPGAVLELKVKRKARGITLEQMLAEAKQQLLQQDYAAELRAAGAAPIHQWAVVFDGKRVLAGLAAPAPRRRRAGG